MAAECDTLSDVSNLQLPTSIAPLTICPFFSSYIVIIIYGLHRRRRVNIIKDLRIALGICRLLCGCTWDGKKENFRVYTE